ncbi:MAG: hypothetical protein K8I02_10090, partial [Candidatus Methylomirabilis sp.]|nr:hypothetical protein [Deltaproteobacteria bacterium]
DDLVRLVARSLGKRRWIVHLPAGPVLWAVRLLGRLMAHPPIVPDQVMGLLQDTEADIGPARRELGFAPRALSEGNLNA